MKKLTRSPRGKGEPGDRRKRLISTSVAVSALLVIGGVAWASTLQGASRTNAAQDARTGTATARPSDNSSPAATAGTPDPGKDAAVPAEPGTVPVAPPGAGEAAPPASGEVNPAPVDRAGKSEEELAAIAQPSAAPVDFQAKKEVKGGVSATITELTAVQGIATGIGEVAGPAIRFKITVVNNTGAALLLDRAVVDVSYGKDAAPAGQLSGPGPVAFPESVAPGQTGDGVFVFAVPNEARDSVTIHFNLEAETPIATFAGKAPV
ncbi:hypothetical protein [Arthrobacter sp. PAMC25284]|uniref:hypothetical protein n=1 Tax=Arthrobacter sp. PAMC25284 TaxID=2861279 RepID=UPI001C63A308|nr:hypothetical protein [Arthrobacter sp. PAMC25284]QYF90899.1 hypothetical protein KY499_06620 [Arthrobacter sp. PAMC25284]